MNTPEKILTLSEQRSAELRAIFFRNKSQVATSLIDFELYQLRALFFLSLRRPSELAKFFELPLSKLEEIINEPEYKTFTLPKKKGGKRQIEAPGKMLKAVQTRLNLFLQSYYLLIKPRSVFGFVKKRVNGSFECNIAENAKAHIGKKYVLNLDLRDFFPGIHSSRVRKVFASELFRFDQQLINALTLLVTYQSRLPTGAPTSPVISNFICMELDKELEEFAYRNGFSYSRYADDLTFSTNSNVSDDDILDIILIIQSHGFSINEKKLRVKSYKQRQTVTGVVVNKKVNVDRRVVRKVRAMIFDLVTNGPEVAARNHFKLMESASERYQKKFIHKIHGYLAYIHQVRGLLDPIYCKYHQQLSDYLKKVKEEQEEADAPGSALQ